jgi:hypothetical protein
MKKEVFKKGLELLEETLDPLSDRYRICPNPSCRKPHMVRNKGRDYCCDKCADEHYNLNREYRNLYKAEKEIEIETENAVIKSENQKVVNWKPDPDWLTAHNKTIEVFNSLTIDPVKGTKYNLDHLVSLGANLLTYSAIGNLHNIDEKYACKSLVFDDYRLFLIDYNVILIYYYNNQ